jgi:hypothetical protein
VISIPCPLFDALKQALEDKEKLHALYREWHTEYTQALGSGLNAVEMKKMHNKEAALRSRLGYCEAQVIKWAEEIVKEGGA